mgnify:CR=1 FL=1
MYMPPRKKDGTQYKPNLTGYVKSITLEEFNLLLSVLKPHQTHYRLILIIMYYMGLRVGEVVRLKYSSLQAHDGRNLLIYNEPKTGQVRERVIPDLVQKEIETYLFIEKHSRPYSFSSYLFPVNRGKIDETGHIKTATIQWLFKNLRDKTGLTYIYHIKTTGQPLFKISAHTLRHGFITNFYEKSGNDIILTQRVIGHKKITTTANYIKASKPKEQEERIVNMI